MASSLRKCKINTFINFYTPVLKKRDILWYGTVRPSVCLSVNNLQDILVIRGTILVKLSKLVSELCPFENHEKSCMGHNSVIVYISSGIFI